MLPGLDGVSVCRAIRLRRKIERDPQDPEMLLTAWGVGYKFGDG